MKKFLVYLLVIVIVVSAGFAVFYLVRDNEVISISSASLYQDVGDTFTIDVEHKNKKKNTTINITSSNDEIVSYNKSANKFVANKGGVARINFRTTNAKFRNLWCDVIVGDGTAESPFYISTAEQLAAIGMGDPIEDANGVLTGEFKGAKGFELYESDKYYKLVANIDASAVHNGYWVPLKTFNGRLDGNGLTISNINIDRDAYIKTMENDSAYNPNLFTKENVGFVGTLGANAAIYNVKFVNFNASGEYDKFGSVAAVNHGHIERVELKDSTINVKTKIFGGLVAQNITTDDFEQVIVEPVTPETDDESITLNAAEPQTRYVRNIARIDRCSIALNLGSKVVINDAGEESTKFTYNANTIGGLVGENIGGTIVYSYTNGDVYFGVDESSPAVVVLTYGGLVGINQYLELNGSGGKYTTKYQGGNIKDCYSNITTHIGEGLPSAIKVAGAIAVNIDYSAEDYDNDINTPIVQNYILGVYYNKGNLNYVPEGSTQTKNYKGIASFTYTSSTLNKTIDFEDTKTIVYGLTREEMQEASNFVSHTTKDIKFDETNGNSLGIVEEEVLWLFDTVWAIDVEVNDGMPYLNYQLVYIPDDFETAGVAVMKDQETYTFIVDLEYDVEITTETGGKLYISVNESYDLQVSPYNAQVTWTTTDSNIVAVDPETGVITGKAVGSAMITATTRNGASDSITVIVEQISYSISGYPSKVYIDLAESATKAINGIIVTPATDLTTTMQIVEAGTNNPKYATASVTKTDTAANNRYATYRLDVQGLEVGHTAVYLTAGRARVAVEIEVIDSSVKSTQYKDLQITTSPASVSGVYGKVTSLGVVTVSGVKVAGGSKYTGDLDYDYRTTNSSVVNTIAEYSTGGFEYEITGVGTASIIIDARYHDTTNNIIYQGSAQVQFTITKETTGSGSTNAASIDIDYERAYMCEGEKLQLKATTNTGKGITWSSGNSNIAKVSSSGLVTAVSSSHNGSNTTYIYATTQTSSGTKISDKCLILVLPANDDIEDDQAVVLTINPQTANVTAGDTISVTATATKEGSKIVWFSNDSSLYTSPQYSGDGKTTSTIQVKIADNISGTLKLTAKYYDKSNNQVASATSTITITCPAVYNKYIKTVAQLQAVRNFLDKEYILCNDLDLSGISNWEPIGTANNPFTGSFNGKYNGAYHTITGLKSEGYTYAGLFGYVKDSQVKNFNVVNSQFKGAYAGVIACLDGSNAKAFNIDSTNNVISAYIAAGGIVGLNKTNGTIQNCVTTNCTISGYVSNKSSALLNVGGIVGVSQQGAVTSCTASNTIVQLGKDANGNVGGIGGSNILIQQSIVENCSITANTNSDNNFAGGITGKACAGIVNCKVSKSSVKGYYAGGIGGELNHSKDIKIIFKDYKSGYQKDDISEKDYNENLVNKVAVADGMVVEGVYVGGLFSIMTNGAVNNCYTWAKLKGLTNSSILGGFAAEIRATGLTNVGGTGKAGIVDHCYSASTFEGSGKYYYVTSSLVHNYKSGSNESKITNPYGFVFNYVFDEDIADADWTIGNGGIFDKWFDDEIQANKSTSEMKNKDTYTAKGFSTSVWEFNGGYPTIKF